MKKNSICKIIVSGLLAAVPLIGMAQQVCGNKPWSVSQSVWWDYLFVVL